MNSKGYGKCRRHVGVGKRMLWMLLAVALVAGIGMKASVDVQAAEEEKKYIQLNQENVVEEAGYYYFTLPGCGRLESEARCWIYQGDSVVTVLDSGRIARLPAGEYRVYLDSRTCLIKFTPEPASSFEQEFNNSFDTANVISANMVYSGNLEHYDYDKEDYYKIILPSDGSVYLDVMTDDRITFELFKEDSNLNTERLFSSGFMQSVDTQNTPKFRVAAGTYYVKTSLEGYGYGFNYQFKVVYNQESADGYETEANDTQATADTMKPNVGYTGNIQSRKDADYYSVTLPSTGKLQLRLQTPRQTTDKLFKAELLKQGDDGKLQTLDTLYSSENPVVLGNEQLLDAGTYYVKVEFGGNGFTTHTDYNIQCIYDEQILVQTVTLSSAATNLAAGDTAKLAAVILPANAANKTLAWTSNDAKVAKVDQSGNVTCVAPGEALIRATSTDGSNVYGEFHIVVNKRLVTGITVSAKKTSLLAGDKTSVTASVSPSNADNPSVIWESSNPKVATVNQNGTVTAVAKGKVSIKAIAEDGSGVVGSVTIAVTRQKSKSNYLRSIIFSKGSLSKKFHYKRTSYVLTLSRNTSSVKIVPQTSSKYSSFTINGKKAKSVTVKLARKQSKYVNIVVTSESGVSRTYRVKVVRK